MNLMFTQTFHSNAIPLQDLPLLSSSYPILQEHSKLPGLLVQIWLHWDESVSHSSISTE